MLADLSIKRPVFITCIVLLMLAVGYQCLNKLGVDLFPDVTFPVVTVSVPYPGAGPQEIETLVSKPIEEELSTLSGVKRLSSISQEGVAIVVVEFTLETDVKVAEQQVRDHVGAVKSKLPTDIKEPIIKRIDPADQPIVILALDADLAPAPLFDLADQTVKPRLQQVSQVGQVDILGGRKREIRVELDRDKLNRRQLSATQVAQRLAQTGENVPAGKVNVGSREVVFRTLGQYNKIDEIRSTIVSFVGNDVPITIGDIATVKDDLQDTTSYAYINGKKSLFVQVYRQSGANTIQVVEAVKAAVEKMNRDFAKQPGSPKITVVRDGALWIRSNVDDVKQSILMGVILAILVVYLFLANGRSTIITGLALPNSLIGSFVLMAAAGFTINIMTLLALSLAVGLLVDDAIVVRENIFRHIEMGAKPIDAARFGTKEVQLAVIATTFVVIAVFGPVGFLKGVVGQFFKQFGLTICFAMAISLFDALTVAPMLSAYFAGRQEKTKGLWSMTVGRAVGQFTKLQDWIEVKYIQILKFTLRRPFVVLGLSFVVFIASSWVVKYVPKTFLPAQDAGEFLVSLDLAPGTSLDEMRDFSLKVDQVLRLNKEINVAALTVGDTDGESNVANFYVHLVPAKQRRMNTSEFKEKIRLQLKPFAQANPKVKDFDAVAGGFRPFNVDIVGLDQKEIEKVSMALYKKLRNYPALKDVDTNFRPGKPEFQIALDPSKIHAWGLSTTIVGQELRTLVEGATPAKYRENGNEYDIRVRLKDDQRNLSDGFDSVFVPNINLAPVRLRDVAHEIESDSAAKITRQDRGRYIQVNADITPGAGLEQIMTDVKNILDKDIKMPPGLKYVFIGQAENFAELKDSMATAILFGITFIFLVLASLYESFVIPFTIMLALPLAICGAFFALFITQKTLDIFSMIGCIMLLGIATKNSILLVDFAQEQVYKGVDRAEAILNAGRTRLRPILMTTMALIAGTLPVALGLNEASRQRTSMGVAIIGGLISSTVLTLVVVPAAYSFVDRFRVWSLTKMKKIFQASGSPHKGG